MSDEEPARRRMVRPPTAGEEGGRGAPARLKTAKKHTPFVPGVAGAADQRSLRRPGARRGYRSRAAFKLTEIDDRFHLIRRGGRIIDLGCAPGGWIQVALERGAGMVVGVDCCTWSRWTRR